MPASRVTKQPTDKASTGDSMLLSGFLHSTDQCGVLTDLQGDASWSYHVPGNMLVTRAVPGGTVLVITFAHQMNYTVSEIDLTGTPINSITLAEANAQLTALGQQSIIDFNHEAMRLPNGYTAIIAHNEALYTDVQGGTPQSPVDIVGDEVLVLDTNWNVVWTWNAFDWLPVSRPAVLNETCAPCTSDHCCPITLAPVANDWLHSNSLAYDSTDGNLIMSIRHQDWIIKINYADGTGDGSVIWTLGNESDLGPGYSFTMLNTPNIPNPWFSHQHDVEVWVNENPKQLTLFDNGNTRHALDPPPQNSRGQALIIDEVAQTVDIQTNVNFDFYSNAYGTSQILDNGNYWWVAGAAPGMNKTRGFEYAPSGFGGILTYSIDFAGPSYRSFRLDAASGF